MLKRFMLHLTLLLLTALCAGSASAQSGSYLGVSANDPSVTQEKSIPMSFEAVKKIARSSTNDQVASALMNISTGQYADTVSQIVDLVAHGGLQSFATPVTSKVASLTLQNTLNVSVKYDPRPVGGILSIRVELVPVFAGIGSPTRAVAFRELAQAVDYFDDAMVTKIVSQLTAQLGSDIAQK